MLEGYISIEEKSVYGRTLYYPVCEHAKQLAKLANKKTFNKYDLEIFDKLKIYVSKNEANTRYLDDANNPIQYTQDKLYKVLTS
tara:strand:- start:156 stop:407 length:252 start_codon:yes stop_codon:yes gene_type:complete